MNKGEAIKILNTRAMNTVGILSCLDPNCSESKSLWAEIEALDMAMEALKEYGKEKP